MKRRIVSAFLAAAMLATSVPESAITALAADTLLLDEELLTDETPAAEEQGGTGNEQGQTVSGAVENENASQNILSDDSGLLIEDPGLEVSDSAGGAAGEIIPVPEPETEWQEPVTETPVEVLPATEMAETQETVTETAEEMITEEATELYPEIPAQEETLPETGEDLLLSDEALTETPLETETVPSEEMILAEEELLETETEAETELAAEESEITAISIDASAVAQVSQFELGEKIWDIFLTVQYGDGSTEAVIIDRLSSVQSGEQFYNTVGGVTGKGTEIYVYLSQNINGETVYYSIPFGNEVLQEAGQYTLIAYENSQENGVSGTANITVTEPSWIEMDNGSEQSYNVSPGGMIAYHISSVAEESVVHIKASEDTGGARCRIYSAEEETGAYVLLYEKNFYARNSVSYALNPNENYYLLLSSNEDYYAASGIINLRERKSLQSISVNADEQSRNVIEFENWLYKIPVTLTYTTGESETLETSDGNSIWTSGWNGNYSVLEIRSSEGDVIQACLLNENGDQVNVPGSQDFEFLPGTYTLEIYAVGNESVETQRFSATVTACETLSNGGSVSFDLGNNEKTGYIIQAQPGEYFLRGDSRGENTSVYVELYKKEYMDTGYNYTFVESSWLSGTEGSIFWMLAPEEETEYTILVSSWSDFSTGSLTFAEKSVPETIKVNEGENLACSIFSFEDMLGQLPVTVFYPNGQNYSTEIAWSNTETYYDEETSQEYQGRYFTTDTGDTIGIKLQKEDGSCVDLPAYDADIMSPGTYQLVVYDKNHPEVTGEINVTLTEPEAVSLGADEKAEFSLIQGESQYYRLVPESAGTYQIIFKTFDYDECDAVLYRKNGQSGYERVWERGEYTSWENQVKIQNTGEEYLLMISPCYSYGASGTVAFRKMKEAIDVVIDESVRANVFKIAENGFEMPVTVYYESDGEPAAEAVKNWSTDSEYDDESNEWYSVLTGNTDNGDKVILEMSRVLPDGSAVRIDVPDWNEIPVGQLQAVARVADLISEPAEITIEEPSGGEILELDQPGTVGENKWYMFTVPETGSFVFNKANNTYLSVYYGYYYDSSEQLFVNTKEDRLPMVYELEQGDIFCLRIDDYEDGAELLVTRYKEAESYKIGGETSVDGILFTEWVKNLPVSISYSDGSEERVSSWDYDFDYDEDGNEYGYLKGYTAQGVELVLKLYQNGSTIRFPYEDYSGDVPIGTVNLELTADGIAVASSTVTVDSPDFSAAIPLALDTSLNISLGAGEYQIYYVKAEESIAGSYGYSVTGVPIFDIFRQDTDGVLHQHGLSDYDAGVFSGDLDIAAGETYYMLVKAEDKGCNGALQTRRSISKERAEIISAPRITQYIEGLPAGTNSFYDLSGLAVKFTYTNSSSSVLEPDEYNSVTDSYGNDISLELYMTDEDGNLLLDEYGDLDYDMDYTWENELPVGVYTFILNNYDGEYPQSPEKITVISKEEAAAKHPFDSENGTVTFHELNGYYVCTAYTPETAGEYRFEADSLLEDVRIFRIEESKETEVVRLDGGYEFGADLKAGQKYILAIRPAQDGGSLTLTAEQKDSMVEEAVLSPVKQEAVELIAGLEGFSNEDWAVDLTYKDGSEGVTLQGMDTDQYGNAFRYEVQNKSTGKTMTDDGVYEQLNIGSYLVTAVHRTLSALRSNSVQVEAVKAEPSGEITEGTFFTLQESDDYQIYSFTPAISGSYELQTEVEVPSDVYTQGKNKLERNGWNLTGGTTYIVAVASSPLTQTATVKRIIAQETVEPDQAISLEMPKTPAGESGSVLRYRFTPEETGRYYISLEKNGEESQNQKIYFTVQADDGYYISSYQAGAEKAHIQCELEAEKDYLLIVSGSRLSESVPCTLKIEKGELPTAILVEEKAEPIAHLFRDYTMYDGSLFNISLQYADGSVYPLSAETGYVDVRGNQIIMDSYWEMSGRALTYEFMVAGAEEISVREICWISTDTSELPKAALDVPVSMPEEGSGYFTFTPETTGEYCVNAEGTDEYNLYIASGVDNTRHVDRGESLTLTGGVTYIFCVNRYDEGQDSFSVTISSPKTVTDLELLTPPDKVFPKLESPGKGMTARVTYGDGTTADISALDWTDDFGNKINTQVRTLPDGRLRVILSCGSRYVTAETDTLTVEELTAVNSQNWSSVIMEKNEAAVLSFTPSGSGLYTLEMEGEETGLRSVDFQIWTENLDSSLYCNGYVYLKAGERYVVLAYLYGDYEEAVTVRLKMRAEGEIACEHIWDTGVVTKDPTCVDPGVKTYTCTICQEIRTEEIPATGHQWKEEWTVDLAPTCTEEGKQSHHCTVCDAVNEETVQILEALGHTYLEEEDQIQIQPSCTTAGSMIRKCSRCRDEITVEIPATGHQWGEWEVTEAASCTQDGVKARTCQAEGCGLQELERIPATGHVFDETADPIVEPATDTENGREYWLCQNGCGQEKVKRVLVRVQEQEKIDALKDLAGQEDATADQLVEAVTAIDGQALLDADEQAAVTLLSDLEQKLVAESQESGTVKIAATKVVSEDGTELPDVTVTGAAVTVAALAEETGEEPVTYSARIAVTDQQTGTDETTGNPYYQMDISMYTVTNDQVSESKTELQAPITITMPVPAGYENLDFDLYHHTDSGKVKIAYSRSGNTITFSTPSLSMFTVENGACQGEHTLVQDTEASAAPTCTEPGTDVFKCGNANCCYSESQPVASSGHDYIETSRTEATCTAAGEIVYTCQNCQDEKTVVIETAPHTYGEWSVTKEATCMEEGEETRICSVCQAEDVRKLEKVPHTYDGTYTTDRESTCIEPGQESMHCTVCGTIKEDSVRELPLAEHSYSQTWTVDVEPGCETKGSKSRHCTVEGCSARTDVTEMDAVGHKLGGWETTKAPTCTAAGTQVRKCTVCQKAVNSQSLNALGHTGGTATCKAKAVCTRCGQSYGSLAAHAAGSWKVTKAPTCAVAGVETLTCRVCGAAMQTRYKAATGQHRWGAYRVTKAATALAAGVKVRSCTVCGTQDRAVSVPKLKATIKVNASSLKMKLKQSTSKLKVTGMAKGDYVKSWKSSNTKIVKVSGKKTGTCKLTAQKKTGKATITITLASGKKATVKITVQKGNVKTTKVTVTNVTKNKLTLNKGKSFTLKTSLTPITSQDKVTYTSSNKKVATVSSKGVIKAKSAGKTTITVKAGSKKVKVTVTVPKTATKKINKVPAAVTIKKGKKYTLKAKRSPSNSDQKLTYKSSNKKVATVSSKGVITAKKKGTAVITVTSGKVSVKCKVTVK